MAAPSGLIVLRKIHTVGGIRIAGVVELPKGLVFRLDDGSHSSRHFFDDYEVALAEAKALAWRHLKAIEYRE